MGVKVNSTWNYYGPWNFTRTSELKSNSPQFRYRWLTELIGNDWKKKNSESCDKFSKTLQLKFNAWNFIFSEISPSKKTNFVKFLNFNVCRNYHRLREIQLSLNFPVSISSKNHNHKKKTPEAWEVLMCQKCSFLFPVNSMRRSKTFLEKPLMEINYAVLMSWQQKKCFSEFSQTTVNALISFRKVVGLF